MFLTAKLKTLHGFTKGKCGCFVLIHLINLNYVLEYNPLLVQSNFMCKLHIQDEMGAIVSQIAGGGLNNERAEESAS